MSGALALARRVGWVAVILTLCLLCRRARGNGISTFDVNALERLGQIRIVPRDIDIIRCASLGLQNPTAAANVERLLKRPLDGLTFRSVDPRSFNAMPYFDFNPFLEKGSVLSVVRFSFTLRSTKATTIVIAADGRTYIQFLINGNPTLVSERHLWLEKFAHLYRADIHSGDNRIEARVVGVRGQCSLSLALLTLSVARQVARENWIDTRLTKYIYNEGDKIAVDPTYIEDGINTVFVDGLRTNVVSNHNKITDLKFEGHVLHRVRLYGTTGEDFTESIAMVDNAFIERALGDLRDAIGAQPMKAAEIDLLSDRLKYLLRSKDRRPDKLMGERDLVDTLAELDRLTQSAARNPRTDWLDCPGRHYGVYAVPGAIVPSPYAIYLPRTYTSSKKFTLVVVYPSLSPGKSAFAESYFVDLRDLVESYMTAADECGMVVLWPPFRSGCRRIQIQNDVAACIRAVTSRFSISPDGIMLIGACESAKDALIFAAQRHFKVLAVAAQEVDLNPYRDGDEIHGLWPSQEDRMLADNLKGIPIFLSHGALDRHVPVTATIGFAEALRAAKECPRMYLIPEADEGYFPQRNNQWIFAAFDYFSRS